ncbi:LysR family transcriptional regulator [Halioxenophilus sp. WMMB6]|uniref:LysR family transcriptional regulator n=1 Tax=Halioxenophilus sp. WMMB6 TaxID=3073815 RepID=UPI00295F5A34|nr:LysR family transcriptional regulator [Halioxenophilus sp. WMMB6]
MRDWENLRYFLAVARQGTVLGAANQLGVSHSTVLRRIEQFEKALGSKLFKKLQRGYELTLAGEELYQNAQAIEGNIDHVLALAEGRDDVTEGKLRISQPEIGIINVYPLYAEFRRQHPEITLEVHSTMQADNINQQEVDIVIRISESPPELLAGRCLGKVKGKAYANRKYLDTLPADATPADYDWIVWQMTATANLKYLQSLNIANPKVVMYAGSMPDVVSAIHHGMGAGFLSTQQAQLHKNLVALFDGQTLAEYSIWILTHRDLRNSERVRTFMRFMAENLILD